MTVLNKIVCGVSLMGCLVSGASAGLIVDVEGANLAIAENFKAWSFEAFIERNHDLSDQGFIPGLFGPEKIESGTLSVAIADDDEAGPNPLDVEGDLFEVVMFQLDLFDATAPADGTLAILGFTSFGDQDLNLTALGTLNATGMLDVFIYGTGDFFVGETTLTLTTVDRVASVPEPGVLMLLGLGLVGLRVARPQSA